ncbi:MAG: DUF927 domain-containing protein [Prolixibacteraceae bacterium]|jgi:hypothetical protein|nr:DUF927 domain-containing protein [Prolixibacteraceae bacterium]
MEQDQTKIPNSEDPEKDVSDYGFFVQDGKYFSRTFTRNNEFYDSDISNFVMKSLFHLLNGTNNTRRIIFLQRSTGETYTVEIFTAEMKPDSFENVLRSNRCTFYGSATQLKKVFAKLMDEEKEAFIISEFGWIPAHQIFAFADAIFNNENQIIQIDEAGIIQDQDKRYYLPAFALSNLHNEDFKTERLYKYLPGTTDFATWSKLYFEAFGANGLIGILFLILAVFRDIVFDQVGFFPFLFLFGDFGTGKTSFADRLLFVFGRDTIGTPLYNATTIALNRLVSSRSNEIFYFKEYTNETDETAEDFILTAYDGAGRTTGIKSNDNKTKSFPIKSAMIFDGNHLPTSKSAILSRMILLNFENQTFTLEEKTAFNQLKKLSEEGFGMVLTEILCNRAEFLKSFKTVFSETTDKIKEEYSNLPERTINHVSLVYTALEILKGKLTFPFNSDQTLEILRKITDQQSEILLESSPVNIFWMAINFQIKKGLIIKYDESTPGTARTSHYRVKIDPSGYTLQIKFQPIYPFYTKYCKENNINLIGLSSLRMLLTSSSNKTFIHSNIRGRGQAYTDKVFGSCYQFMLTKIDDSFKIGDIDFSV